MTSLQEFKYRLYLARGPLVILAVLLLLTFGVYLFSKPRMVVPESNNEHLAEMIRVGEAPVPAFSETAQKKLEQSPMFHALVSYTGNGFEPYEVTIKKGETVRFTNNSSQNVWIAAHGAEVELYPRTHDGCGSSDLDSCEPFAPQDFWQFTFDVAGEWGIVNNLDKVKVGKVIVRE